MIIKFGAKIFLFFIALSIVVGFAFSPIRPIYGEHGVAPILPRIIPGPFGGKIHDKRACNCIPPIVPFPYGHYIEVGPPLGGKGFIVLDSVGSILIDAIPGLPDITTEVYKHNEIEEGEFVLGVSQIPPLQCYTLKPKILPPFITCKDNGIGWYVEQIGTSDIKFKLP